MHVNGVAYLVLLAWSPHGGSMRCRAACVPHCRLVIIIPSAGFEPRRGSCQYTVLQIAGGIHTCT